VQRLQSFIFQKQEPKKVVQTPVFEFAVWKYKNLVPKWMRWVSWSGARE
jgi:hypothetical protein